MCIRDRVETSASDCGGTGSGTAVVGAFVGVSPIESPSEPLVLALLVASLSAVVSVSLIPPGLPESDSVADWESLEPEHADTNKLPRKTRIASRVNLLRLMFNERMD